MDAKFNDKETMGRFHKNRKIPSLENLQRPQSELF